MANLLIKLLIQPLTRERFGHLIGATDSGATHGKDDARVVVAFQQNGFLNFRQRITLAADADDRLRPRVPENTDLRASDRVHRVMLDDQPHGAEVVNIDPEGLGLARLIKPGRVDGFQGVINLFEK